MRIFNKVPEFKFLNKKYYAFALSGLIILAGLAVFLKTGFAIGIDFSGGTLVEVAFKDSMRVGKLRGILSDKGMGDAQITQIRKENRFFIKTMNVSEKAMANEDMEDHEVVARHIEESLMTAEEKKLAGEGRLDLNNNAEGEIELFLREMGINEADARETAALINNLKKRKTGMIADYSELEQVGVKKRILSRLRESTYIGRYAIMSVEIVGPQVGAALRNKTTLACIWALLGILLYVAYRFKRFLFGLSGVLTLFHDVLVCLAFILFFRVEMSLLVITALLTIVGYSINDTIVVFDRLRENLRSMRKEKLETILDATLNQTLSRSIITSLTLFLTVLSLFIFGGEVIHSFALVMLVGVITGTYSTIYQSCAWLKVWEKGVLKRKKF